ncbi:MAG TPA: protein translocase subunit SecF [Bryobacteraceae bacterium]|jgi:preprotein translocase subunit SecF|nr:protein translocase subunit SecF [Bryobacteraceae bacterium]
MELFKDVHFDFLGRKWWFILPSLILTFAGLASLVVKGGPRYGIDFSGGAVMDVRWAGAPPIERIRAVVSSRLNGVSVVAAHDLTGSNEVLVSAELPAEGDLTAVRQTIDQALSTVSTRYSIHSFEAIGPQIGADLRRHALMATAGATGGMLLYLAWRFRTAYGVAAVVAMIHDAFITIGLFSLLNQEISLTVVAAVLTLIGYSMNDTIVVFDRIRENRRNHGREPLAETINRSINQTLSRTILTSGLTLLTALSLFLFGGPVLHGFSLALVIGIIVGTFSSIFIASPILLAWESRAGWSARRVALYTGGVR